MNMLTKTIKIVIIIMLAAALILGAACYCVVAWGNIADSLTVEIGNGFTADDYKVWDVAASASFVTDMSKLDLSVPGDYPVEIAYYGRTYNRILHLVDTVQPTVTTKDVTVFYTQSVQIEDFIDQIHDNTAVAVTYGAEPDMTMEGEQEVQLCVTDMAGNVTLSTATLNLIFDRNAPKIEGVSDMRLYVGNPLDLLKGVSVTDDLDPSPVLTVDDSAVDQSEPGVYTITYTAKDICGNETVETATLTVIHDIQGPQIFGVNKLSIYQGSTVSYRSGVVVTDDYDENPVLSIDNSQVDLSAPGTYDVTYVAKDAAGNETTRTTTITVKEKKSSYVEESVIYAKADELLAEFITEDMTVKEQVEAIYNWVRRNCYYSDSTDKTDRNQAAYKMMMNRHGDCYGYYAICSLFMDRLNIPNIMVTRNSQTWRHYWSMVSVDGGENYYHFDATPAIRIDIKVCLATDAVLRKCNSYVPGYYAMAAGVYPKTPEEPLE